MSCNPSLLAAVTTALGSLASADGGANPALQVLYVLDWGGGRVVRLEDIDFDGDYHEAGEGTIFYDEDLGVWPVVGATGIAVAADGSVFFGATDRIVRLSDGNGDGDAHDPGEVRVFFDGRRTQNAGGLWMSYASALEFADDGALWVSSASTSSVSSYDSVLRLFDLNGDGDAVDVAEAAEFYRRDQVAGIATSEIIPWDIELGNDGRVYYLEGSLGTTPRGVYVLDDLDGNGRIDPATEVSDFFLPQLLVGQGYFLGFSQSRDGTWYVSDEQNGVVLQAADTFGDGVVDRQSEAAIWASEVFPGGTGRRVEVLWNDSVMLLQEDGPVHLVQIVDGENRVAYRDDEGALTLYGPVGLAVDPVRRGTILPLCGGDGALVPCPCGNDSTDEFEGCLNSTGVGARMTWSGTTSVTDADLCLDVTGAPPASFCFLASGSVALPAVSPGAGVQHADGLRCIGQNLQRHGVRPTDASGATVTSFGSTVSLAAQGALQPGVTRYFQVIYRDDPRLVCQSGRNATGALAVLGLP